jgi:hypothetical protein
MTTFAPTLQRPQNTQSIDVGSGEKAEIPNIACSHRCGLQYPIYFKTAVKTTRKKLPCLLTVHLDWNPVSA